MNFIKFNYFVSFEKQDLYQILIFLIFSISILLKSYSQGYLSPDSSEYLALAQNLLNGNGYFLFTGYWLTNNNSGHEGNFFAVFPVGYPTLIYLVSKLTGFSVYWSSKILSILVVMGIFLLFRKFFKKDAYIYSLLILFASYLEIFSYTWSETIFIFSLVWFSFSINKVINSSLNSWPIFINLTMASIALFLSRYIGAFSIAVIGSLALYNLFVIRDYKKAFILFAISLASFIFMGIYLYNNYLETGSLTGILRFRAPETNFYLFLKLLKAIFAELVIPIHSIKSDTVPVFLKYFILQFGLLFILWLKYKNFIKPHLIFVKPNRLTLLFSIIGLTYLLFIVLLRWFIYFDGYDFRLLAPGTFLLFIALISHILDIVSIKGKQILIYLLLSFSLLSVIHNVPKQGALDLLFDNNFNNSNYNITKQNILNLYQKVEKNSIVVFPHGYLKFIRLDLKLEAPYSLPYVKEKEEWSDFLYRIDSTNSSQIYMMVPTKLDSKSYSQSVIDAVSKYESKTLVILQQN